MQTWRFEVEGPLVGFIVNQKPWTALAKRYVAFKERIRLLADVAGVPDEIPTGHRAVVNLDVTWRLKRRIDLSNLQKVAEDGVFKRDRGIGEIHAISRPNVGRESMVVTVGFESE